MTNLDLHAVAERYHRALDAKPSKGEISADGIAAITDSVADVPDLLREIQELSARNQRYAQRIANTSASMQALVYVRGNISRLLDQLLDLVADWQANGNSRALGDPRAHVWQECARQLLDALDPEPDHG